MREKADALLIWNQEGSGQPTTEWLTGFTPTPNRRGLVWGFTGTWSILLLSRKGQLLITDGRYATQAKREAKGWDISITSGQMSAMKILERLLLHNHLRKILFDGTVTPYSVVEELKSSVTEDRDTSFRQGGIKKPTLQLISKKQVLQELRLVKEQGEIQILAEAAKRAGRAFKRLIPYLHVGMTERNIAQRLEALCREEGAEGFVFPTSVASGTNGALPHAKSTDKKIRRGELITIDFGIRYKGYSSDMTRMVAVGPIFGRIRKMFEAVKQAQELACQKAKGGMTGKAIDALCRGYLTQRGLGTYFTHSTGHGLGMEVHELPIISSYRDVVIPAGAVITCEPGVYVPGIGGVRIEDTLVLTEKGNINLSSDVTKDLVIV